LRTLWLHIYCWGATVEVLETVLLAATLVPAIYLLVEMERGRVSDPEHVRRFGAAVARDALEQEPGVIGSYDGAEIHGYVRYLGMRYRYEGVVPTHYRSSVQAGELFVEPGLLYVTD
jgi:hypothetical protein